MTSPDSFSVIHHPAQSRFSLKAEGETAVLDYSLREGVITFTHTGVPPRPGRAGNWQQTGKNRAGLCPRRGVEGGGELLVCSGLHSAQTGIRRPAFAPLTPGMGKTPTPKPESPSAGR